MPHGGPYFLHLHGLGGSVFPPQVSSRVNCSQLQPVRFASRPQFALSPLAALFQPQPAAARRSPSPMPRQSAPSPAERIPFPRGEDLHRDTPVIILPRAGPNLYGAEPHDSPLLPHTHTRTRAQVEDTFAFWKPGFSRTTPFLFSRFVGGEPCTLSGDSCCQDWMPPTTTTRPLPPFPPLPPIQVAMAPPPPSPSPSRLLPRPRTPKMPMQ